MQTLLCSRQEKTLKDLGDKVSADDKAKIEAEIENVKAALGGEDNDLIKEATKKLSEVSYEVFGKVYGQADSQANAAGSRRRRRG